MEPCEPDYRRKGAGLGVTVTLIKQRDKLVSRQPVDGPSLVSPEVGPLPSLASRTGVSLLPALQLSSTHSLCTQLHPRNCLMPVL